jgi:glycosyltransferase involved in cell wall biosynthesis
MKRPTLAVASFGDPRNPKTWSGTSRAIINALERIDVPVEGIDISLIPKLERFFYCAAFHLWRFNPGMIGDWLRLVNTEARSDFNLMRRVRNRRAHYLTAELQQRGLRQVLHMVPYGIPVGGPPDGIEHYLMLDGNAHLESQFLPTVQRPQHITKALIGIEREMFSRVKHFFVTSEHLRDDLIRSYRIEPSRITRVGTGRSLEPFRGVKDYERGHILFTAKARFGEKGGFLLAEAFKIAHTRNPSLRLVMVGNESHRKALGEIPGVTAYGHLPPGKLQELFHSAALYAMPALAEPWGLVYLEALASKTPLLGLRRLALPEFTNSGRFGFLVDEASPEAVADQLLKAMSNPDRLRRMGEEGQAWSMAKYSWDAVAQRIVHKLFAEVPVRRVTEKIAV